VEYNDALVVDMRLLTAHNYELRSQGSNMKVDCSEMVEGVLKSHSWAGGWWEGARL